VRETHGPHDEITVLRNAALRHEASYGFGRFYGLAEASVSDPEERDGYFSLLAETQVGLGAASRHRPFYRVEFATRPEYEREAASGPGFFRYDHDAHAIGATRWLINTVGYGFDMTDLPVSARPFVEASHNRVQLERGPTRLEPATLLGARSFWNLAAGVRIFLGGGPMRMGTYGVLDPMTVSMREAGMPHRQGGDHGGHGMMGDPGMHRAMSLIVRLLDDPVVQSRIHAVPEYHHAWEDDAVQTHIEHMRRMHGGDAPQPQHDGMGHGGMGQGGMGQGGMGQGGMGQGGMGQGGMGQGRMGQGGMGMMTNPGMRSAMTLVTRLLDDPVVQSRIHTVPEYHEIWMDPAVQAHLARMREMHGGQPTHQPGSDTGGHH